MFARIAPRYDLTNRVLAARRDVAWRRSALGMFDPVPERLLDLACGTGDLGLLALEMGRAQRVIGTDFCLPMLQAGAHRMAGHMPVLAGDAMRLPFAAGGFDGLCCAYGWRNVDDPAAAAREMRRVLAPGGQVLILEFFRPEGWFSRSFHVAFRRLAPLVGGALTGDGAAYAYLQRSMAGFLSVGQAREVLTAAGFQSVQVRSFFGGVSHALHAVAGSTPA
jgi:demethylmenaquinone methyltransferase/2-methoxy-6-polyprenyl-1,4-benzoquinol methylase